MNIVHLILQDRFWLVPVPFFSIIKFLAQFPVDHFLHSGVSNIMLLLHEYASPALARPSDILTGWSIEINGIFEAERPPTSAGSPSGGRAATLTSLSPMYSTRPCCLV